MKADVQEKTRVTRLAMCGSKSFVEEVKITCPISLIQPSVREFLCDIPKTRKVFLETGCAECSQGSTCVPREALHDLADEEVNTRPLYAKQKISHSSG
jgi:hypothetical protein